MKCPKCNEERGCSCKWEVVPEFPEDKICSICADEVRKERIKNDPATRIISVSSVPIQRGDIPTSDDKTIWHQTLPNSVNTESNNGIVGTSKASEKSDE